MALFKATQVTNKVPVPSADSATEVIAIVGDFTIPTGFASNDVVEMGPLPAGYIAVEEMPGLLFTMPAVLLGGLAWIVSRK